MKCVLLPSLNSDLGICDAARVSMSKSADNFTSEQNAKLLKYLFDHKHWSPFGHAREVFEFNVSLEDWCEFLDNAQLAGFNWSARSRKGVVQMSGSVWAWYENLHWLPIDLYGGITEFFRKSPKYAMVSKLLFRKLQVRNLPVHIEEPLPMLRSVSFRIKAPVFVARQLVKHQVGLCWNEESRRYVDSVPEFFCPDSWRSRPEGSIKQGSSSQAVKIEGTEAEEVIEKYVNDSEENYEKLIACGVAPELARMVLPQSMMTEWIWTGCLPAFKRVCNLRLDAHAQSETRQIAELIDRQLDKRFGVIWRRIE